jgi:hypothetical protein
MNEIPFKVVCYFPSEQNIDKDKVEAELRGQPFGDGVTLGTTSLERDKRSNKNQIWIPFTIPDHSVRKRINEEVTRIVSKYVTVTEVYELSKVS